MQIIHTGVVVVIGQAVLVSGFAAGPAAQTADQPRPRETVKRLAQFPDRPVAIRVWMKQHGWASKRHDPRRFAVGQGRLHLVSRQDSVMIGTERGFPVDPNKFSKLRFTIRIDKNPVGTDPHKKAGDDSAFRLYVAFDRGGGWLRPPNSIAYYWTEKPQRRETGRSPHYKTVRNIFIGHGRTLAPAVASPRRKPADGEAGKAAAKPTFVTIERDLLADYRRCFPEDRQAVPNLTGVLIKCDTNDTGTTADAWLTRLELVARPIARRPKRPRPAK